MKLLRSIAASGLVLALFFSPAPVRSAELVFDVQALAQAKKLFTTATDTVKAATSSLKVVTSTLNEVRSIVRQGEELLKIVGNPVALLNELGLREVVGLLKSVQELNDFGRKTFDQIVGLADPIKSLTDPKLNPFSNGRNLNTIVNGLTRDTGRYKPFSIIETQFSEHQKVVEKDRAVQTETAKRTAELTEKLKSAKTENERENIRAALQSVQAVAAQSAHQLQASGSQVQAAGTAFNAARWKDAELDAETEALLVASEARRAQAAEDRLWARLRGGR